MDWYWWLAIYAVVSYPLMAMFIRLVPPKTYSAQQTATFCLLAAPVGLLAFCASGLIVVGWAYAECSVDWLIVSRR